MYKFSNKQKYFKSVNNSLFNVYNATKLTTQYSKHFLKYQAFITENNLSNPNF